MDGPALSDIAATTGSIIAKYRKKNQLTSLTPRMVRQEVENVLKLTAGTLDEKVYRDAVKEATSAALADKESDNHAKAADKGKKRRSGGNHTEVTTKKAKSLQPKSTEQPPPPPLSVSGEDKKGKVRKESKVFKSVEIIETSDEEEDTHAASPPASREAKKTAAKAGPSKTPRKTITSSSDHEPDLRLASSMKAKSGRVDADIKDNVTAKVGSSSRKRQNDGADKSESEMSVLIDASPVKKKSKSKKGQKAQEDAKKDVKVQRLKKTNLESSKHGDTVRRLKSLVHACGVRKIWSKEFQNLDQPLQQVKRLKEILVELGMDGRPSMEKAKAIKEKRDLAKELEDVRAFEQSVTGRSSRLSRIESGTGKQPVDSGSEEGSENPRDNPSSERNAARRSIMAFLGDDSDGEE